MLLKVFHAAALSVVCAEVKAGVMVDTALARSPSCAIFSACFTRSSWAKAVAATVAIIAIIIIFFIGKFHCGSIVIWEFHTRCIIYCRPSEVIIGLLLILLVFILAGLLSYFLVGSAHHLAYAGDGITLLLQVNQAHALGSSTHHTHVGHLQTNQDTALIDDHQVIVVGHHLEGHQSAGLIRHAHSLHTCGAAGCLAVVFYAAALAVAIFAHHHDGFLLRVIHADHADYLVIAAVQTHTAYTGGYTTHHAHIFLIEANGATIAVGQEQYIVSVGQSYAHHLVVISDVDSNHTVGTRTAVSLQASLLDGTVLSSEYHVMAVEELLVIKLLDTQYSIDGIITLYIEQVLDGAALRGAVTLRYLIALQPEAASLLCEEEQRIVHRGRIDIFRKVSITVACSLGAYSTSALLMEFTQGSTLHISQM